MTEPINPPAPADNETRLEALRRYGILDTPPEEAYDGIARLAAHVCAAPIAVINFIDEDRQWFKAAVGLGVRETPLDVSICAYALRQRGLLVVPDLTRDGRFAGNPLVATAPHLRFYAGAPLETPEGHPLGTLCVLDYAPRVLDPSQADALRTLARQVMAQLELRRELAAQSRARDELRRARDDAERARRVLSEGEERHRTTLECITDAFFTLDRDWRFTYVNGRAEVLLGRPRAGLLGKTLWAEYPDTIGSPIERSYRRAMGERVTVDFDAFFPPHQRWYENHLYPTPEGVAVYFRDVTERKRAEEGLREQTRIAEALNRIGVLLAAELDLSRLVQVVTDEATLLTDARFGAFFYNVPDGRGSAYTLYTISGVPREEFSRFPMPRATALFGPTFRNEGVVRLDDVTRDPRFGKNPPYHGMPAGHLPVRSYLAVPVASRGGEVLGGLFFGHPEPGVFTGAHERLAVGVAAQAAVAIDNARLYQDLSESERRFRHLADAMPQLVWVTRPDRSVEYINRRWLEYTGQEPGQCRGPADWAAAIHPDDLARVDEASVRSHATGEPFEAEYRIRDAAGNYRWHLGRAVPVFDEAGRLARRFGAATDIDDRKRSERDARFLAEASATLAAIVDEASTLQRVADLAIPFFADWCTVDLADAAGSVRRVAVAHVDPAKVGLAHDLNRRYPPDPDADTGAHAVIRSGQSRMMSEISDATLAAAARDDDHLAILRALALFSYMCVPLRGRAGTLGAISFVSAESGRRYGPDDLRLAEDLASRAAISLENARLYGELKEADRRKDEFLATLAHELRNPLAPIRNALHLIGARGGDGQVEAERAMAERNVVHLARLIDDLMDVARINRGRIELSRQAVDLATVLGQAVETARPLIDERRHALTVELPAGPLRLDADPTRLEQVFWNLLNNAAKYTEPGGRIVLSVEPDGAEVVVRVRDTGIGIRAEMLPRVFDMFVQAGEHRGHAQGGLGIGLSLVRNLVEMHGGTISARSDGPGRGSEFAARLPLLPAPAPEAAAAGPAAGPGRPRAADDPPPRRRILVVDDNVDAARSLGRLLARVYGQEVRLAHDGPEALGAADEFRPEVVLLDIGLPGMDGNEVARRLRVRPEFESTLIVALTGWGQESDLERSRAAGFDHHLVKPANPEAIVELLAGPGKPASRARGGGP